MLARAQAVRNQPVSAQHGNRATGIVFEYLQGSRVKLALPSARNCRLEKVFRTY